MQANGQCWPRSFMPNWMEYISEPYSGGCFAVRQIQGSFCDSKPSGICRRAFFDADRGVLFYGGRSFSAAAELIFTNPWKRKIQSMEDGFSD